MQEFKRKLWGCLDLMFLFPRGIKAFDGKKEVAIKVFIIAQIIGLPLLPITAAMVPPHGMEDQPYERILFTAAVHYIFTSIVGLALTWQIAGLLEKRDRFWLGMEAGTWCSVLFTFGVMVPLLILDHYGVVPRESMDRVYTILACYGFIFGGCILYAVYRLNLFLIIGWSMMGLFIDRESWNLLYALQGLPPLP